MGTGKQISRDRKEETRRHALPREARQSKGLGIYLGVWGRAEGGVRRDVRVSAHG